MNLGAGKIRFPPESKRTRFSGKDGLDHFGLLDSGQAHVQTLVLETEIFVVDSELMEHGGMQISARERRLSPHDTRARPSLRG